MGRHELTDAQWHQLAPLLPPQKPRVGRPSLPHRRIINGILWILATGAPWGDLPPQYGSWHTVSSRFYRWQHAGIWPGLLQALQRLADCQGQLNWTVHFVDSTIVRAHQHAAGARAIKLTKPWDAAAVGSARRAMCGLPTWQTACAPGDGWPAP